MKLRVIIVNTNPSPSLNQLSIAYKLVKLFTKIDFQVL